MKTSLSLLALGCCLFFSKPGSAQEAAGQNQANPVFKRAVGLHFGSDGVGYEISIPLARRFNLRTGTSILPVDANTVRTLGRRVDVDMNARFMNHHAVGDWQVFGGSESVFRKFVLSAGGGYFFKASGAANFKLAENYRYGQLEFTPDEVGKVRGEATWNGFAPYAGLGFTNLSITKKLGLGINLGTFYMDSPDVKVSATNMLSENTSNQAILKDNLRGYKWLPVLQFNFNFNY